MPPTFANQTLVLMHAASGDTLCLVNEHDQVFTAWPMHAEAVKYLDEWPEGEYEPGRRLLGDALHRTLAAYGTEVLRRNARGDWHYTEPLLAARCAEHHSAPFGGARTSSVMPPGTHPAHMVSRLLEIGAAEPDRDAIDRRNDAIERKRRTGQNWDQARIADWFQDRGWSYSRGRRPDGFYDIFLSTYDDAARVTTTLVVPPSAQVVHIYHPATVQEPTQVVAMYRIVEAFGPTPQQLLESALAQSGLSLRRFAEELLARDERTARRWREGTVPIPETVQRWLRRYLEVDSAAE